MMPIFNVNVCLGDVGEFIQEYAKEHSIKDVPRRLLIGSYFGKLAFLHRYLNHGLVITQIYTVVEYISNAASNSFMTQVARVRLDGDRDKDKSLIAENHETHWKLKLWETYHKQGKTSRHCVCQ